MFKPETQVLQFRLDGIQPETIGKRCIDVKRLTGNLVLLVNRLTTQCPHIMQAVSYLNENDTNIIAHRQQKFLEILSLSRCMVTKDATRDFGQAIHNLGNLRTKHVFDIFHSVICILYHIVKEG